MTQLAKQFSELSNLAKSLDEQALDFVQRIEDFAKDLEIKLNKRRKKYSIEVRVDEQFDFRDYRLDFFIRPKDQYVHYVFTMSISDVFDEDEILQLLDVRCKELYEKG